MLRFPYFHRTATDNAWIASQMRTSRCIRTLWSAASKAQRADPEFLRVLARCAWVNNAEGSDEARLRWRNTHLARWAGLSEFAGDAELIERLVQRLELTPARARWVVRTDSGITRYYPPLRRGFDKQLRKHAARIAAACRTVATLSHDSSKVEKVAQMVLDIPEIAAPAGGRSAMLNGLSPLLACLDPQRRFPIINARTARLLAAWGKRPDADGAASLSRSMIGQYGIRHAFDLDVYAQTRRHKFPKARHVQKLTLKDPKAIGVKAEESTIAVLSKTRLKIRRRHNALMNRFRRVLEGKYVLVQTDFDALIEDWTKGRRLLVEAKPSTSGPVGRMHLRQAIGQLYDYRWRYFPKVHDRIDLALLTPSKPDATALSLLAHLGIEALWFEGKPLRGTIKLLE